MRHFEKEQLNIQLHVIMPILINTFTNIICQFCPTLKRLCKDFCFEFVSYVCLGSTYQLLRAFRSMIFMKLEDFQDYTGAFFFIEKKLNCRDLLG